MAPRGSAQPRGADVESFDTLGRQYARETRPILARYCLGCHSTAKKEGELDLERFGTLTDARRSPKAWQKVAEMLDNGEMPPKDAKQPPAETRKQLRGWVAGFLDAEARASAGDPGPVVLRRLSNSEYNDTVQDLTGVDLQPARDFPVDGAAGEGFTNTGNALVMSPALLTKYLDAGKEIAKHAVLLPDGIRFSPGSTRRDWTDERLAAIRALYSRYADPQGYLPLEKYLAATLAGRSEVGAGEARARSFRDATWTQRPVLRPALEFADDVRALVGPRSALRPVAHRLAKGRSPATRPPLPPISPPGRRPSRGFRAWDT